MTDPLPVGKLPPEIFGRCLADLSISDSRVLVGPGPGLDCAVIDIGGERLLVLKSDPITFVTDELGEYLVRINTNDLATTGADPGWMLATLLLPEGGTTADGAQDLMRQVHEACERNGIALVGGHTEITQGLDRPIAVGALVGEVARERLVTPRGARPGDWILLTKGVPIEGTAILAHELPGRLAGYLSDEELERARGYLHEPGLDVLHDARIALAHGRVTAMHDPTESGLAGALWELAEASGRALVADPVAVPVPELARRACEASGMDPLATIASGALLLTVAPEHGEAVRDALSQAGIPAALIGEVREGPAAVRRPREQGGELWVRPERDEIARALEGPAKTASRAQEGE